MQYGQKADFGNEVVEWALKNVRKGGVCDSWCVYQLTDILLL